jgi:DNA polymerase III epsilon subunit family exonuclease
MEILDGQPLVVIDLETTGLYPLFDRVCEVGILRVQGDEILDSFQTLVNPGRPISPGASRVNGLTDADVCQAPPFADIARQTLTCLDGSHLVCHNAPFDLGFLEAEFSRLGMHWQPVGVIDTLQIARRYFSFPSNALAAIASDLEIETPHAHRALGDALTTLQVFRYFQHMLNRSETVQDWDLVGAYHPLTRQSDIIVLPPEIEEALEENKAVVIPYIDAKGQETARMVTPRRVLATSDVVYLVSYCHMRQAERHFRLDRIIAIAKIE